MIILEIYNTETNHLVSVQHITNESSLRREFENGYYIGKRYVIKVRYNDRLYSSIEHFLHRHQTNLVLDVANMIQKDLFDLNKTCL